MDFAAAQSDRSYRSDQQFFTRQAHVLAGLIVFGFLQWALRGFISPLQTPFWIHAHSVAMLGGLGIVVAQNDLVSSGNLALQGRLGWASLALVLAIVSLGTFAGRMALAMRQKCSAAFIPPRSSAWPWSSRCTR